MKAPQFPKILPGIMIAALIAGGVAQAASLSKGVYDGAKDDIKSTYKAERDACKNLAGNAKDICIETAKGRENVAMARLEFDYTGKTTDEAKWHEARYEARYEVCSYADQEMLAQSERHLPRASAFSAAGQEINLVNAHREHAVTEYH